MDLLVIGGAGYIGSHTVRQLLRAGHQVVIYDNFSTGHAAALPQNIPVVRGDLLEASKLLETFKTYQPDAVIHFAALIDVGESMRDPARYYQNNVVGSLHLLKTIAETHQIPLVFSSTAAVYGSTSQIPIPEDAPLQPDSVYGETKLITERMIHAFHKAYDIPYTILRYFNVCGAAPEGDIGEAHPNKTHLIELACLTALGQREKMLIYGEDYNTPDGTCIRDYLHVQDLADAHILAVEALYHKQQQAATYNVGLGQGFSVREVLNTVDQITGQTIHCEITDRRPGDPPILVAHANKIVTELGFKPQFTHLQDMVQTAWQWHKTHPEDFKVL